MILKEEVFKIGKFTKPHGIKGEIALHFDSDIFDRSDCPYLICLIDGIFVPFFINEYRFKGEETALFLLDGINSEKQAKTLCGKDVFFPRKFYTESINDSLHTWSYFIGFNVIDNISGEIGRIKAVDEATINTLFLIEKDNEELIIPASEDFISKIDTDNNILYMDLPTGLI